MAETPAGGIGGAAIAGVDHSIVGVADLESARKTFQAMGFTITPRGRHVGWATANYCIMFPDDYVELLGILDPAGYTAGLDRILAERGEGILKLVLRSADANGTHGFFNALGLAPEPVRDLSRELEMPDGTVLPEFRLVHPDPAATPGVAAFICQHLTPEIVWQSQWLRHRNGATGVRSYTILADEPAALAEGWSQIFGEQSIRLEAHRLTVETGTARLGFSPVDDLPPAFEGLDFKHRSAGEILGMTVAVSDLARTAACLAENGADCMRTEEGIAVSPESACGLAISFVEEA